MLLAIPKAAAKASILGKLSVKRYAAAAGAQATQPTTRHRHHSNLICIAHLHNFENKAYLVGFVYLGFEKVNLFHRMNTENWDEVYLRIMM